MKRSKVVPQVNGSILNKDDEMGKQHKYASYADFEKDEYLRVKTFYEDLEDIMDEDAFSSYDESKKKENQNRDSDVVEELRF